ncbi:hypothetical protein P7C70_g7987, partial [Phenoliferia sp. Uapishka_3]
MPRRGGASLGRLKDPNPTHTFSLPFGNSQSNSASPQAGPSQQQAPGSQNSPPSAQRHGSEENDPTESYWTDGDVDFLDDVDSSDRPALGQLCRDWELNVHGKRSLAEVHRRFTSSEVGLTSDSDDEEPVSKKAMLRCSLIHSAQLERGIARIEEKVDKLASSHPAAGSVATHPIPPANAAPSLTTALSPESKTNAKSMVGRVFLHPEFCGYDDNAIIWETVLKMLKKRPEQLGPNIDCLNSNNTSAYKVLKAFVHDKASKLRFHLKELIFPVAQLAAHLEKAIPLKDFCEKLLAPYHISISTSRARRICLLRHLAADPEDPVCAVVTRTSGEKEYKEYSWSKTWLSLVDQQLITLLEQKQSGREGADQVNMLVSRIHHPGALLTSESHSMFRNLLEKDLAASGDEMRDWDKLPETLDETEVAAELV